MQGRNHPERRAHQPLRRRIPARSSLFRFSSLPPVPTPHRRRHERCRVRRREREWLSSASPDAPRFARGPEEHGRCRRGHVLARHMCASPPPVLPFPGSLPRLQQSLYPALHRSDQHLLRDSLQRLLLRRPQRVARHSGRLRADRSQQGRGAALSAQNHAHALSCRQRGRFTPPPSRRLHADGGKRTGSVGSSPVHALAARCRQRRPPRHRVHRPREQPDRPRRRQFRIQGNALALRARLPELLQQLQTHPALREAASAAVQSPALLLSGRTASVASTTRRTSSSSRGCGRTGCSAGRAFTTFAPAG